VEAWCFSFIYHAVSVFPHLIAQRQLDLKRVPRFSLSQGSWIMTDQLKELMQGYENNYPSHLVQQFPRIVKNLVSLWHSPDAMNTYLEKLLILDRPHRQGFPAEVASELIALSRIYDEVHHIPRQYDQLWH
jgi:hypothetical protein